MKLSARILIGAAIGFVIIAAGLAVGVYFSGQKATPVAAQKPAPAVPIPPNPNIYDVSPPSRADLSKTKTIDLPPSRPVAYVMLPKDDVADIKAGQQILLYDQRGTLIETFGSIRDIKDGSGPFENMVTLHVTLDNQDGVDTSTAVQGAIITGRNPAAARLPLSALLRDDQNEPYVWIAQTDSSGKTTARFQKIKMASTTYDFFTIEEESHTGENYILNPDKSLKNGQEIRIREMLYAGPLQTDESRVAERVRDKKVQRDNTAARKAALEGEGETGGPAGNCGAPGASGTAGNSACAPQPGAVEQFMRSVGELAPAVPAPEAATEAPLQNGAAP